jgi:P-type Cu+ transporter
MQTGVLINMEAPQTKENKSAGQGQSCYHCGEPVLAKQYRVEEKSFCCEGCKLVYEILNENNLCTYYSIEPGKGNSPGTSQYAGRFAYLDREEILSAFLVFRSETQAQVTFFIPGIHCSSCIWLLENLQKLNAGVYASTVNFPRREVSITYDPRMVSLSALAELLSGIGYEPHISLNDLENRGKRKADRSMWYKIGVAGFSFGNIMMMSFPEYFSIGEVSDHQALQNTFSWLNLSLALPVLLYSSRDFFISSWAAIRHKHLNIDLPIAAAILMTFLRSVYEVLMGIGPGYFDSMTGIVFFMLIGRVFQNRTYETLSFDRDYRSYFPVAVTVLGKNGEGEHQVTVSELRKGMIMRIRNQEVVPADAILLKGSAQIDYSFVTGESQPVAVSQGALIYAGGRQTGSAVLLEIVKPVQYSYLTQLWNHQAFRKDNAEEEEASLVNRINYWFTIVVFALALISGTYWFWMGEPQRTLNAVTTILIVACPCILLLAATFTRGNVLRILGRGGLYLKNAFVLEKLAKLKHVVFDKTGTLTLGNQVELKYEGELLDEKTKRAIYSLAIQSNHPLSKAVAHNLKCEVIDDVLEFAELPGLGLKATINGDEVRLGSAVHVGATADQDGTYIYLWVKGKVIGRFVVEHRIRAGLSDALEQLKQHYPIAMLSGDNSREQARFAPYFEQSAMHFNQTPADKLQFIAKLQSDGSKVMMVGDGLNDAGALQQSDVGVAVSDNMNTFSPACDAILDGKMLKRLPDLLWLAGASQTVIKTAFALSLIYNVTGLYFALQGELEPVIAAILMPTASISIVSFVTLASSFAARRRGL